MANNNPDTAVAHWRSMAASERAVRVAQGYDRELWLNVFHRRIEVQRKAVQQQHKRDACQAETGEAHHRSPPYAALGAALRQAERFYWELLGSLPSIVPSSPVLACLAPEARIEDLAMLTSYHIQQEWPTGEDDLEGAAVATASRALLYLGDVRVTATICRAHESKRFPPCGMLLSLKPGSLVCAGCTVSPRALRARRGTA